MKSRITLLLTFLALCFTSFAQSDYLSPNDGFLVEDIISDKLFASYEVNDGKLYGFDTDGIHAYDLSDGTALYTEAKPESYAAQPSFMNIDASGTFLWMGFTKSDYSDDRIYRFDLSLKTWEHMATLPANFDLEFSGDHIFVSGLNSGTWGDPNNIWLLDISGDNNHIKLIETGGSSAGIACDNTGNIYYASYFSSEDNSVVKWDASDIETVIDGGTNLTFANATTLSTLPAGAYDCDMDDNENLVFNCNDFTNGGFVAIWNGTAGNSENYTASCTTTEWLTFVKATGNVNLGGKFYTMAYAQSVAEIKKEVEYTIEIINPIADQEQAKNISDFQINVNEVFEYEGGDLSYSFTNSDSDLLNIELEEGILIINAIENEIGSAIITITATSGDQSASDEFEIEIFDYNYTEGVFIVNEDWFGHDNGTVNFITNGGQVVYRAFRHENTGETLGTTTQFATTFGEHIIFMSKQGNRLVICNRETLELEASFEDIGADGRAFMGYDVETAYIGTSDGIKTINLETLTLGNNIEGISGETGLMLKAENYVFICQSNTISILNNGSVIETISAESINGIARTLDGNVWVSAGDQIIKINPETLENEIISLPDDLSIAGGDGAWNAGSFCASTTENSLFFAKSNGWSGSNEIFKFETDDINSLNAPFTTLTEDWILYGAGLRVHPISNEVYATATKPGWGENSKYNNLFIIDGETGNTESSIALEDYYWFPAMPLMVDKYAPVLVDEYEIDVDMNHEDLSIDLVVLVEDMDNLQVGIEYEITNISEEGIILASIVNNEMNVQFVADVSGEAVISLRALSNGRILDFEIPITIHNSVGLGKDLSNNIVCSPNPFQNSIYIQTNTMNPVEAKIYSLGGQLVWESRITESIQIDGEIFESGSYILQLISENETHTQKIIKN